MESALAADLALQAYHFDLPEELVAQTPALERTASRLFCYERASGRMQHRVFGDLPHLLQAGDLLVLNNTRVFPARLYGTKSHTGTRFEFLLLYPEEPLEWWSMAKYSKRIQPGYRFDFPENVQAVVTGKGPEGKVRMRFEGIDLAQWDAWLERHGAIPLPPYITSDPDDWERYQTVFAQHTGSVAAPTAGLHFTPALLQTLKAQGVDSVYVTLHVGSGTFLPVRTDSIVGHEMHQERYHLDETTAARLNAQRQSGRRIIAVGTTATRVLETIWREQGGFKAQRGLTQLFVYPGQTIGAIDALITNFHLPCSTLLMLVSAWVGREKLLALYQQAIEERYRFYSFGDAMLLT